MEPEEAHPAPSATAPTYWLTRFVILRLLGAVYGVAFLAAVNQIVPLIGEQGLLPVGIYLRKATEALGSPAAGFARLPSLFCFDHSDTALLSVAWTGLALSCVVVAGYANSLILAALWFLYMSFVHVGQVWYGYGWETQLLETGFLAMFLCPLWDARPFPTREPPLPILGLFRWLIFRIMLGAGLIKLRGDRVWRDFTALYYHFETQPIPNGLSRWFHFLPRWALRGGVLLNHAAELAAPWFVFWPRWGRHIAGALIVAFQLALILSGNLSFLNWLTIVPALACFDDRVWSRILPPAFVRRARAAGARAIPCRPMRIAAWVACALVACLSVQPVANLFSPRQMMNASFDPLDLVNTYGAFGSVGKERLNVVFEGTDAETADIHAEWKPYPYKGLPVALDRRPPQVAPYQLRLDWQMWFAAMAGPEQYPFTLNLVWKLLHNDPGALSLFAANPFPNRPPRHVRALLYRYEFARANDASHRWWTRSPVTIWLPPLSVDSRELQDYLRRQGWLSPAGNH